MGEETRMYLIEEIQYLRQRDEKTEFGAEITAEAIALGVPKSLPLRYHWKNRNHLITFL